MKSGDATDSGGAVGSEFTEESGPRSGHRMWLWLDSLGFRIVALLSIALLPLGIIALAQTQRSIQWAQTTFEATLRAQTAQIATPEREAIVMAFGLAQGLADTLVVIEPGPEICNDLMERARNSNPEVSFVGFTGPGAISTCNSSRQRFDFSDSPSSERLFADPAPDVTFNPSGEVSGISVIIVSQPVYDPADRFLGFVSISLPSRPIAVQRPALELDKLGMFLTFNRHGEVLTTEGTLEEISGMLPAGSSLEDLTGIGAHTFQARALDGSDRTFAVVPIVPDRAYALGSWETARGGGGTSAMASATLTFPILMWLVSLAVALLAINRLVLRHVRALSAKMRAFAEERTFPVSDALIETAPLEFQEINGAFDRMARKIVRDEADLENALFERGVLFKEVHHRVKNNLQLMSSIMNMQIRRARSEEARSALRGVQERITSLATVHHGLYQSPDVSQVRVDSLLRDLIGQLLVIGIARDGDVDVEVELMPLVIVPDQAAPLALLTTEAITNALKYMSRDPDGRCFLSVSLKPQAADNEGYELLIANSVSEDAMDHLDTSGGGLGNRLIDSFVAQLGGRSEVSVSGGRYALSVIFVPSPFEPAQE